LTCERGVLEVADEAASGLEGIRQRIAAELGRAQGCRTAKARDTAINEVVW